MKKIVIGIISVIIIALAIFISSLAEFHTAYTDVQSFNKTFLEYNKDNIYGTYVTTVINKAIDNNENNKVKKDKNGMYQLNEENSVEIYIRFTPDGDTYQMEKLNQSGMDKFTKYFGDLKFDCESVTYHTNNKIATMTFVATNYQTDSNK